jgi:predicted dehydrogenase
MASETGASRRDFVIAAGTTLAAGLAATGPVHAAGKEEIKVGAIGVGGRGGGAVRNSLDADPRVKIVALADAFKDRIDGVLSSMKSLYGARVPCTGTLDQDIYVGFDAYEKILKRDDLDYVILATPPHFRPMHFAAAVAAKKNVFMEKPVAVDPPGARKVMEVGEEAKKLGLSVVAGTQRRHQKAYIEAYEKIQDGAIGKIFAGRCYWNQAQLWYKERADGWSDMEWMIRDWVNWCWLSGDHICEQHIHNIDVINWFLSDDNGSAHPIRAVGMGGRARRVTGDQYDHFSVDFEYAGGIHVASYSRQINGCDQNISEALVGEKGIWLSGQGLNRPAGGRRRKPGDAAAKPAEGSKRTSGDPYVQEHIDLIASIDAGAKLNEAKNVATSTMTAIMGRIAAYTGKPVTWDEMMKSDLRLGPDKYDLTVKLPEVKIPVAGRS